MFDSRKTIFAIVLLVLLAAAIPALAQSAPLNTLETQVASQVAVNQCSAGEPVALNGNVHVEYTLGTDPNTGANLFTISTANDLNGVGQTTGSGYVAADSADYVLSSTQGSTSATVQLKADLNPQGAGTAMTIVQQLQISVDTLGNLSVQLVSNTTSCGS